MGKLWWRTFLTCLMALEVYSSLPVDIRGNASLPKNLTSSVHRISLQARNFKSENITRLPENVVPTSYTLDITTCIGMPPSDNCPDQFGFKGIVTIKFKVEKAEINNITLHSSKDLVINNPILQISGSAISKQLDIHRDGDFLYLIPPSLKPITVGEYTLSMAFSGVLSTDMRGFYRSSYEDEQKKPVWLAATHFEPTGARKAFPCFDEPKLKATFSVTITHNEKYMALSNTPGTRRNNTQKDGTVTTSFDITPVMSTYLLAFLVSDFKNFNKDTDFTKIWARPNAIKKADLAHKYADTILEAFGNFTGIKFNKYIDKIDHAAVPDFAPGAMENWGLILYKEKGLLFDENIMTTEEKQTIVETMAHELAHQWFGNLVSPQWWDYVWLNEGFATFFQSYILQNIESSWRSIEQAVVKDTQVKAFEFDSGNATHSLNSAVETPEEISNKFDTITYQKGGAIIRMMQHFLTEDVFSKGLRNYLSKNEGQYANSTSLCKALQEIAQNSSINLPYNVEEIMDGWVNQTGYPVVTVTRDYNNSKVTLEQQRFFTYNATGKELTNQTWYIPINYASETQLTFGDTTPQKWLVDKSSGMDVKAGADEWIIFNKDQTGYYRVNYDEQNWKLISQYLNNTESFKNISILTRAQLINDALAFVQHGMMNLSAFLDLTEYLRNEEDLIGWYPGFRAISWLDKRLFNTEHYPKFKEFFKNNLMNLVHSLGLEESADDKHLVKMIRPSAIQWSCHFGYQNCTDKMLEKAKAWLQNPTTNKISTDLEEVALCSGLRVADANTWELAFNKSASKDIEKVKQATLIKALACSNDNASLTAYLNYTLSSNNTGLDLFSTIKNIGQNSDIGVDVALDFFIPKVLTASYKYRNVSDVYQKIAETFDVLADRITTKAQLEKLKSAEHHDIPYELVSNAIWTAERNVLWIDDNSANITDWVNKHYPAKVNGATAISSLILLIASMTTIILHSS